MPKTWRHAVKLPVPKPGKHPSLPASLAIVLDSIPIAEVKSVPGVQTGCLRYPNQNQ